MSKIFRYGSLAIICAIVQLTLIVAAILLLAQLPYADFLLHLFTLVCVFVQLNSDISPAYKLCRAVFMLIFPLFGGVFYLLFNKNRAINSLGKNMKPFFGRYSSENEIRPEQGVQKYLNSVSFPLVSCKNEKYFGSGEEFFAEMLRQIEKAERYVLLEFFIIGEGEVWRQTEQLLAKKVTDGVRVCIIIDGAGCIFTKPNGFEKRMKRLGIEVRSFNPVRTSFTANVGFRNHRKLVICDGKVAFCCGLNLADEYMNIKEKCGHWKDSGVMVDGDGARQFTQMFWDMWGYLGGKQSSLFIENAECEQNLIQPFSDTPLDNEAVGLRTYLIIINSAVRSIRLTTPYLICSDEMLNALCSAAKRGVNVQLITPHIPDKKAVFMLTRGYYGELIRAGVEIYEYSPGFIHAKSLLADGETAVVGTVNYDYRSMYLMFECGCVFYGGNVPKQLKADFESTLGVCERITSEKVQKTNFFVKLARGFLFLFAPLV